jgi:hypothetical protein
LTRICSMEMEVVLAEVEMDRNSRIDTASFCHPTTHNHKHQPQTRPGTGPSLRDKPPPVCHDSRGRFLYWPARHRSSWDYTYTGQASQARRRVGYQVPSCAFTLPGRVLTVTPSPRRRRAWGACPA